MKRFFVILITMITIFNNAVYANGCLQSVDIVSTYDNIIEIEYNNNVYAVIVDTDIPYRNKTNVLIYIDDNNTTAMNDDKILWIE